MSREAVTAVSGFGKNPTKVPDKIIKQENTLDALTQSGDLVITAGEYIAATGRNDALRIAQANMKGGPANKKTIRTNAYDLVKLDRDTYMGRVQAKADLIADPVMAEDFIVRNGYTVKKPASPKERAPVGVKNKKKVSGTIVVNVIKPIGKGKINIALSIKM